MSQEQLVQVMQALREAATSDDPSSAEPLCTEAGWQSRADSARRLVRALNYGEIYRPLGPCFITGDPRRAALRCDAVVDGKAAGTAWWLFVEEESGWKVEAFAQEQVLVGLFLEGQFSPVIGFDDLPENAAFSSFVAEYLQALEGGAQPLPEGLEDRSDVVLEAVGWFEPLSRGMATLEFREPGKDWGESRAVVVQQTDVGFAVLDHGAMPGWHALLAGAQVDWTIPSTDQDMEVRLSALLDQVLGKALAALGFADGLPEGSGRRLMEVLQSTASEDAPIPYFDPDSVNAAWGHGMEAQVTARVQIAVGAYLVKQGIDPEGVDPDTAEGQAVLEQHGPQVVRILFASILTSVGTHTMPEAKDAPNIPAIGRWVRAALISAQPVGEA